MDWKKKYGCFSEFAKSKEYRKWLDKKLKDAPLIKATDRPKTEAEIALEKLMKKRKEEIEQIQEEIKNNPAQMVEVENLETGEIQYMTQKEYDEFDL